MKKRFATIMIILVALPFVLIIGFTTLIKGIDLIWEVKEYKYYSNEENFVEVTSEINHIVSPFKMIREGNKTIELRLYDEKRKQISIGDYITFTNTEDSNDTLYVKVIDLIVFPSFDELYKNLPLLECGYTEEDIDTASPSDMEKYYSKEMQQQYGVVGIKISLLNESRKQ